MVEYRIKIERQEEREPDFPGQYPNYLPMLDTTLTSEEVIRLLAFAFELTREREYAKKRK